MSFGFVSGGTADAPVERDDEWLKAQQEIEATRRRKEEESRQEGGKTLYEVLQNNKGDYLIGCSRLNGQQFTSQLLTCQVLCAIPSGETRSLRRVHSTQEPVSQP